MCPLLWRHSTSGKHFCSTTLLDQFLVAHAVWCSSLMSLSIQVCVNSENCKGKCREFILVTCPVMKVGGEMPMESLDTSKTNPEISRKTDFAETFCVAFWRLCLRKMPRKSRNRKRSTWYGRTFRKEPSLRGCTVSHFNTKASCAFFRESHGRARDFQLN